MIVSAIEKAAPGRYLESSLPGPAARAGLPPMDELLVAGGDARIAIDPRRPVNKYGVPPLPDPSLAAFGSSTASPISESGFAAAGRLYRRLLRAAGAEPSRVIYARELDRIRRELIGLCGLSDLFGIEVVFAASGTDLHLVSSLLAAGTDALPTRIVVVEAAETGGGVPAALTGRHFSSRTAMDVRVAQGALLDGDGTLELKPFSVRREDGALRAAAAVDAEVESLASEATERGRRVLLVLTDLSRTGLIAPGPSCVSALKRRWPDAVEVLVDACQFRMAPATLRAYLEQDMMVALTGSKFMTGPTFSGALLIPESVGRRLRHRPVPTALRAYSARADWPRGWEAARRLDQGANFGLLLRWEAALEELRAFRSVPEAEITRFLRTFARAVRERLRRDPGFDPLPVPEFDRRPLIEATGWDDVQTIFPFLLFHPQTRAGRRPLSREETVRVYQLLQEDLTAHPRFPGLSGSIRPVADSHGSDLPDSKRRLAALRCQLGQPVVCGRRGGVPVCALRLCASARLAVEAAQRGDATAVIGKALAALDKAALLVQGQIGR